VILQKHSPAVARLGGLEPLSAAWTAQIRDFASDRLDRDVFNLVIPYAPEIELGEDDILVLAALLREANGRVRDYLAKGKPDDEIDDLVDAVAAVLGNATLPRTLRGGPAFRDYCEASIDWYRALSTTPFVQQFWAQIETLAHADMSAQPDTRERVVAIIADIGRQQPVPPTLSEIVIDFAAKPFLVSNPANFLHVLGYVLHFHICEADLDAFTESWLGDWRAHMAVSRGWSTKQRAPLMALRRDVHTRIGLMLRNWGVVTGRFGGFYTTLTLILIKLDHHLFLRRTPKDGLFGRLWFPAMRLLFHLIEQNVRRKRRRQSNAAIPHMRRRSTRPEPRKLRIRSDGIVSGSRRDLLITRSQGGIGDIMMMRPGVIAAARRRRRRGRVVFATNRAYFPAFSIDDPIDLVDIERAQLDMFSFGKWVNFSVYPEAIVETREIPKVKTNRIDIFARSIGIKFGPLSRGRVRPIRFAPEIEAQAEAILRDLGEPRGFRIGIQLRSAESYRDAPALLAAARELAKRYTVLVFDNRPVPRTLDDGVVAIDNQPLAVAMAISSKLDFLIAPDSFFIHLAGANGIPCLALFGPTDGAVRCRPYPTVRYIDARALLRCLPCWRNEIVKCRLTDSYNSACMQAIKSTMIVEAFTKLVAATRSRWWRWTPRRWIDAVYAAAEAEADEAETDLIADAAGAGLASGS
jgi:hypothetical protein